MSVLLPFARPLVAATLLRRYKRFLCNARLEADGTQVTAHCPNPGAMAGLDHAGGRCWLSDWRGVARRSLPFGLELVAPPEGGLVGINTATPNRLVAAALAAGALPELGAVAAVQPEIRYGARSRVDFRLQMADGRTLWLEVKNVHWRRLEPGTDPRAAQFPDCVTARGARHMAELAAMVAAGDRAAVLFIVQRGDCDHVAMAGDRDPAYARAFAAARAAGVEALARGCYITCQGIGLGPPLPVIDP